MINTTKLALFLVSLSGVLASLPGHRPRDAAAAITKPGGVAVLPPEPTNGVELRDVLMERQEGCASFSVGRATCGFLPDGEPLACYSTDRCVSSASYMGCCSSAGCEVAAAVYYTTCLGYALCSSLTSLGARTVCCNGLDFPHCVTALVGATTRGYNTLFWCGNNRISGTQTLSPTPYEWDATCRSTPTTPSPTPTPSPSTTTTSTVIPTPTETPKPGPPVAAIAGGVVGGLAGLALIILAIFFAFRWGKRKGQTPEAPPQAYIPPQPPHPQPSPDQPPVMTYAAAPAQYVYHPTEPAYSQDPAPTTPYWPGSAGARKTSFEEHVAAAGSPQSAQTAQFPSSQPSPDPRVSQFSASTAVGSGPGSPRGWRGPAELGAERADGELREMRG